MPDVKDYQVDELLTRIAKDYKNGSFIADLIFPRVDVETESGQYYVYDRSTFRLEKSIRQGIARANRVDYGMSLANYGPILEHSLEQGITKREKRVMGADKARRKATLNVTQKILLNHEKSIADIVRSTSVITQNTTLSGTDQWSDYTNSDPFGDVQTGFETIDATGISLAGEGGKRFMAMGVQVWNKIRNSTILINRLGTASLRSPVTMEQAKALFEVDEIWIGRAQYDSAKEGQTPSLTYVWGKDVILGVMNTEPDLGNVSPGYTLTLRNADDDLVVDRWDDKAQKTEFVRFTDYFEGKLVAVEAMYLIKNAVA